MEDDLLELAKNTVEGAKMMGVNLYLPPDAVRRNLARLAAAYRYAFASDVVIDGSRGLHVTVCLADPGHRLEVVELRAGEYDRHLLDTMQAVFQSGKPLLIAPEGGRTHKPGMRKALPGAAYAVSKVDIPVGMPASDNRAIASNRLRLVGACGSTRRATSSSAKGMLKYTLTQASCCNRFKRSRSRITKIPFVMRATGFRYSAQTSKQARVNSNEASMG